MGSTPTANQPRWRWLPLRGTVRAPALAGHQLRYRTTPFGGDILSPHFPGQGAGALAYVQSWLKEKQLSAASTRPGGASAASASIGGSTREAAAWSGGQPPQQPARAGSVGRLAAWVPPWPRPQAGPAHSEPFNPAPSRPFPSELRLHPGPAGL